MSTVVAGLALVLTVAVVALWAVRTVTAERAYGRGHGELIIRSPQVRRLDLALWTAGVVWGASLLVYLGLGLSGR